MIERIGEGQWAASYAPRDEGRGQRRARRPMRQAAPADDVVAVAWDAADVADFGEFDSIAGATPVAADVRALSARLVGLPRLALAAQARLGRAAVTRLIAVNAINGV